MSQVADATPAKIYALTNPVVIETSQPIKVLQNGIGEKVPILEIRPHRDPKYGHLFKMPDLTTLKTAP